MIPKKIHYCWFSGEAFPKQIQKCIKSWKRFLPDYELVLWNMEKARSIPMLWIQNALNEKRWAFAADAVRLYAIYTEGGIYLDSDVEVLKNFNPLLSRPYFFGYENGSQRIEGAVLGAEATLPAIKKSLEFYEKTSFEYNEETIDTLVLPNILAKAFLEFSLEIFPESYFSPKNFIDGNIVITDETFCIHHFSSSWRPAILQKSILQRQWIYKHFPRPMSKILSKLLSLYTNVRNLGMRKTVKKIKKH